MMILVKVSDISNECRPMEVSEPWLECLLQEFFNQVIFQKLIINWKPTKHKMILSYEFFHPLKTSIEVNTYLCVDPSLSLFFYFSHCKCYIPGIYSFLHLTHTPHTCIHTCTFSPRQECNVVLSCSFIFNGQLGTSLLTITLCCFLI